MANLIGTAPNQVPTNQMLGKMAFEDNTNYLQKVDGAMGYPKGMGGSVTQLTSKSTDVTLNTPCGQITMNNAALPSNGVVGFTMNNSTISPSDVVVVSFGGTSSSNYNVWGRASSMSGSAVINVRNISAGSLSDAVVINFFILKGQTS